MKNKIYRVLIIILVLSFLVSCSKAKPGGSSASSSETGSTSDVAVSSEQNVQNSQSVSNVVKNNSNFDSIKGTVVKVHIGTQPNDIDKAKAKEFETKYGCKVEYNTTSWTEWKTAFPQSVASKNPVDYIYTSDQDFINYAAKNLIMPIDQYINMSETKYFEKSIMDLFKWKGKHYLMQSALSKLDTFGFIFYNKTMFEDAGEKEPITYYKEGKWNFDTFRDVARKMSKDTDGDGKMDIRGFASWWYDGFIGMNGNTQVVINDNGTIGVTLNQPNAYAAMQLIEDMQLKDKSFEWNVNQGDMFLNSKVAMVFERAWQAVGSYELYDKKTFPDDIGICPPPKGTNAGDKYYAPALFTGYAIPTGAKTHWELSHGICLANSIKLTTKRMLNS